MIKIAKGLSLLRLALIEGKILQKLQGFDGIPKLYYCGTEGDYNVLVLELLGPNLEDLMSYCEQIMSLKTVIMLADQLIQRMEAIHQRGFIHRDIKSDNFLIGQSEQMNKVFAIDFGLAKRYIHPHTSEHIQMKKHKGLIGTARFASINSHLGLEQSRRDDLQSIGYLIVYLAKGSLPWQKVKAKTKQAKYKKILDIKDSYTAETLCKNLPEFEEKPDYSLYRSLFFNLLTKQNLLYDSVFDWMVPKAERAQYKRQIKRKFKTISMVKIPEESKIVEMKLEQNDQGNYKQVLATKDEFTFLKDKSPPEEEIKHEQIEQILQNPQQLQQIIQDHILLKPYMNGEHQNPESPNKLEIISEKIDENTPFQERSNSRLDTPSNQQEQIMQLESKESKPLTHPNGFQFGSPDQNKDFFHIAVNNKEPYLSISAIEILPKRSIISKQSTHTFQLDDDIDESPSPFIVYDFRPHKTNPMLIDKARTPTPLKQR